MLQASVVVPALNAERAIERCVGALLRQTLERAAYEVIVVDDGSRDATAEVAERAGARVVRLPRTLGPGGARNAGFRAARAPIVVFTDADCEPCDGFLEALVRPLLDDPAVGGTKGTYLTRQRRLLARFVQVEYEDRYRRMAREGWIDFVDTYAACFRRADLERAGGFDERLRQCQDQELSFRLAAAGVRVRFVPEARTYHLHAERLGDYLRKKYRIAWWKVPVLRRHPAKVARDSHTPQAMKLEMAAACATAATLGLAAPIFLLLALPFTLRALRRDPAVGLVAPAILFLRDIALALGLVGGVLRAPALGPAPARPEPVPAT